MKLIYVCPAKVWTRPRESGHMDCCSESDRKGCLILFFHVIDIEDMLLLSASAWFVP